MAITFQWKLSYQNEVEYQVFGHANIRRIETYSTLRHGLLEYQFRDFNGFPEEFRRTMIARQGGVKIEYVESAWNGHDSYWQERRWSPEFYEAFVQSRHDDYSAYKLEHERRRIARGWTLEEFPLTAMDPIPRPLYYCPDSKGYQTEPWYQAAS